MAFAGGGVLLSAILMLFGRNEHPAPIEPELSRTTDDDRHCRTSKHLVAEVVWASSTMRRTQRMR
ncbi:hypothetical protein [Nocardia xishanensis]